MRLRVVLVSPEHDMNVGSVCRAMKNFGFYELWIVAPRCKLGFEAKRYAKHSEEVLSNAKIVKTLSEAVAGCDAAMGTTGVSARFHGKIFKTCLPVSEAYGRVGGLGKVAIVFGPESTGLCEADSDLCDLMVTIPTAPAHRVLNLSHAVAVALYQLFADSVSGKSESSGAYRKAAEYKMAKLEELFGQAAAISPTVRNKKKVATAFRKVLRRSLPSDDEARTLLCAFDSFAKAESHRADAEKPNKK